MFYTETTCYTCLNKNCSNLKDASRIDGDNITYRDKLKFIMNTELQEVDVCGICESCIGVLRITYTFIKMVKASQETIRELHESHDHEPLVEITEMDDITEESESEGETTCESTEKKINDEINSQYETNKRIKLELEDDELPETNIKEEKESTEPCDESSELKEENMYICDYCNRSFNVQSFLREHILTHTSEETYKCENCSKSFCSVSYLKRHHKLHQKNEDEEEANSENLESEPDDETITCKYCEEFATILSDPRYKFSDRAKLHCEQCGLECKTSLQIMKHIKGVHGESQFNCDFCDRSFKRLYQLQLHLHKNYECNLFNKKVNQIKLEKLHTKTSDEADNEQTTNKKPFVCTICGKGFPLRNTKKRHMRMHLGIKKYVCKICSQKFSQSYQLKLHMRRHSGEKPYECSHCDMSFLSNTTLQRHLLKHFDTEVNADEVLVDHNDKECTVFIENDERECKVFIKSENTTDSD